MTMARALAGAGWPVRLLALVALGALTALGQEPWSLHAATLLGLGVLMQLMQAESGWRRVSFALWAYGLGYFGLSLHWIVQPFLVDAARHGWMAPFALVLMASGAALFWAVAGALAAGAGRGRAGYAGLVAALGLAEMTRSLVLTGFPWTLIGHAWLGTPIEQLAAHVGPHGLTVLMLGLAAVLARLWVGPWPWLAVPVGAFVVLWAVLLPGRAPAPDPAAPVVRIVQPNADQQLKWDPGMAEVFFQTQLRLTAEGDGTAGGRVPDLVVWPETAVQWLLEHSEDLLRDVAFAARGAPVVLGIQRREAVSRYFNSLVVVDAAGDVAAQYDKWHLVPFGEYMPIGELMARFGIHGLAASEGGGYSAGPGPALVDIPGLGPAMPLICYEGIFAEEVNAVPGRPRLLILITNDAWFGNWAGPEQHFAQARLRAIEQGLPLVRVANTGISGVIDPKGRVLGRIDLGVEGARDLPLPAALAPTLYSRAGDGPAAVLLILLLGAVIVRGRQIRVDPTAAAP